MDVYYIVLFRKMHSSASSHAIRNIAHRRQVTSLKRRMAVRVSPKRKNF